MAFFDSDGVQIHYEVFGEGKPIVLVHGFASSLQSNWVGPGWIDTLTPVRQVIAIDCRGHGESEKPYDPELYGEAMIDDVVRLLDHLSIQVADVFGYSMGGRIVFGLLSRYPERFDRAVLGGVGVQANRRAPVRADIAPAMEAENADKVLDDLARGFRLFAERNGADPRALAALHKKGFWRLGREDLAAITNDVLIVVGENDTVVGSAEPIAKAIPNARLLTLSDRDHLTAVGDQHFKDAVVSFLRE